VTRPTADRVREALFQVLDNQGAVEGRDVLDLCAGTGALGIEALSRGAASATFVEQDPAALRVLRQNIGRAGLDGARVVAADALALLAEKGRSERRSPLAVYGLVLVDPPYALWPRLAPALAAGLPAHLSVDAVVACERDAGTPPISLPGFERADDRRYGRTAVTVLRRRGAAS
jgi:16S rRNA (guanine966-N2)-methyltransferase